MIKTVKTLDAKSFCFLTLVFLITTNLAIFLNTPFLRQILGFFFLTILPGLLILQILKLNEIGSTEKFVLSVGLSVSFLMFFGLSLNNLLLDLEYETPLSTISLLISFNVAFIILAIIGCKINKDPNKTFGKSFSKISHHEEIGLTRPKVGYLLNFCKNCLPNLNLTTSEKAFLIVPIFFPALSIFGMHIMNTTDNNIFLMILLFLIPAYVAFVCFFNQNFSKRLYPVVIFSISISLLLLYMLRFPHIHGSDVHIEYYFFQTTLCNLHWTMFEPSLYNACLSISLLPTIYQSIININTQEYFFKGIYVSIFSFCPLVIYTLSKKYVGNLYAFIASFFFMSQVTFLTATVHPRTVIAIFFAALAIMVFFNDKIEPLKKRILFIIFMLSIVISHYSTAYIFFFVMLFSWLAVEILLRKYIFKKNITLTAVLLFFAFIFFWYSQVTGVPFNYGVKFVENTFINLNKFFIMESREGVYMQLAGVECAYPILSRANWIVTWSTFIFIGIGVLTMLKRYKEMIVISNINLKKPDFLQNKFEMEYLVIVLACVGLLIIMVALPYVSQGYHMYKLYLLMVIILSVCFSMGGMTLANISLPKKFFLKKKSFTKRNHYLRNREKGYVLEVRTYVVILIVLIPYFLFGTGVIYQICGASTSITLNSEGEEYNCNRVHDHCSYGAKWLKEYGDGKMPIYTDRNRKYLSSQGGISQKLCRCYPFPEHKKVSGYFFLRYYNVVDGKLLGPKHHLYDMTEYSDIFGEFGKVYANGGSEVWKK